MAGPADGPGFGDGQWRTAGERIQALLDACEHGWAAGGPAARDRAEELVREVVDLYGEALRRTVALSDDAALRRLADDDLIASLLLVHGLHPDDVRRRVSRALDKVRPYLGSHGGDVELLDVTDSGAVLLRLTGSCKSCPSSAVTLELAVEDAVRAAAPEVTVIEVVPADEAPKTVIPPDALMNRIHSHGATPVRWHPVPNLADLTPGEVGGFDIGVGTQLEHVLACRVGDDLYAYRDHCPACDGSLAGAALHRAMGSGNAILRCPRCLAHYDVVHAGAGLDGTPAHLEPLPLLVRDGVLSLAIQPEPTGLSA